MPLMPGGFPSVVAAEETHCARVNTFPWKPAKAGARRPVQAKGSSAFARSFQVRGRFARRRVEPAASVFPCPKR